MKNNIEETIKQLELILKVRKEQKEIIECAGGWCVNCDPDIKALTESIDILKDYKRVLKENEYLKEKWDKDTHRLQNYLDVANADKIDLIQQNEELRHKVAGQLCVIETQAHNEEVYERTFERLEKENKELKEEKDANYTTVYLKGIHDEREKWERKVKDKIEELENEIGQLRIERGVTYDSGIYKLELKREALQELLEKE